MTIKLRKFFSRYFFLLFLINISVFHQSKQSDTQNENDINNGFKPIRTLIDFSIIDVLGTFDFDIEDYKKVLNETIQALSKLLYVQPITEANPIKLNFDNYPELNIPRNILNGKLINGTSNYDVIYIIDASFKYETNIQILSRDNITKRPTLGYMKLSPTEIDNIKNSEGKKYFFIQKLIQFLGFSYENFLYFNNNGTFYNKSDDLSQLMTNYIKTEKVLEIAKKYYNCSNIEGIPLENQNNNSVALWESRILLGDIMSSYKYNYHADQVISEFTLALLEDSGWYKANYYTGGLMRFGKNKGCEFFYDDCSSKFKNEFCDYTNSGVPSCSSGRQTLTYCGINSYSDKDHSRDEIIGYYKRYSDMSKGPTVVNYCIINEPFSEETKNNIYVGNCKYNQDINAYGSKLSINSTNYKNRVSLASALNETFSNNSFCVLASMALNSDNEDDEFYNLIHPLCYEMYCSEETLTIGIKNQFVACPRAGGKVEIKGEFSGYIYCPDYNLICTGTVLCNDMFDCIEKKSLIKNTTYYYDYSINTSQNLTELRNSDISIGYEITTNGKCRQNCGQCYINDTCFYCRENYYLVADYYGQNLTELNCINKNISIKYFTYDGLYYYPCIANCDKCSNETICEKCSEGYYFIGTNRTYCDTGKNLSKYYSNDEGVSYFPCYTNFNNCELCVSENNCTRCQKNYYFLSEEKTSCEQLEDKSAYFTEDFGVSYLLVANYIPNCFSGLNRTHCTKCQSNYYMIGDDKTKCYNDYISDFNEYYTEDGGISYYPCYTYFNNCLTCENRNTCTKCQLNYDFIRGKKEECFPLLNNRTYRDELDGFIYLCYDSFPFCDKCSGKNNCFECFEDYYFTYEYYSNGDEKLICDKIDISKYYKNNDGIYILCNKTIENCDECRNENECTKCKEGYYFLKNNFNKCLNNLDLRKYYSEDNNISFYPCNETINQCDFCSNKSVCEQCYDNFYLYKETLNDCVELDNIEKYYKKGISYYPCNESITNCEKCFEEDMCYECNNNLKIIYQEQNICHSDNELKNNDSLVQINDTFYMKCSDRISHCKTCEYNNNNLICTKCEDDYIYLNENKSMCINKDEMTPEDEYIKINETNYFTCDYQGVKNCIKCESLTLCNLCQKDYAFSNNDYSRCHKKSDMEKGFYHDFNEIMYYSCIKNCELCINSNECIKCEDNFTSFENNKYCGRCELNLVNITDNLTQDLLMNLSQNYFNLNEEIFSNVDMFINSELNFNIVIFRASICIELIFEIQKNMEINLEEFINNKISDSNYAVVYINNGYKSLVEIYLLNNEEKIEKINITEICPECDEWNYLKIKKNFGYELNNELTSVMQEEIIKNNYNIFNKDEKILNDLCKNLNIRNIDIPINERRKILYLGNKKKQILCSDINCDIKNVLIYNTTSYCECKINSEFNYLFEENDNDINNEEYEKYIQDKKNINSFLLFSCAKEAFDPENLKNNIALYISIGFIVVQIILLMIYSLYRKKRKTKKSESNPPKTDKIGNFSISDDFEEDEKGDVEQKIQKKEIITHERKTLEDDDEDDEEGDDVQNIQEKDIDSARAREIENEIREKGGEINEENLKIEYENYQEKRNGEWGVLRGVGTRGKKNKLKFLEENFEGNEQKNGINGIKTRNNIYSGKRLSTESKDSLFSKSDINNMENNLYQNTEYIKFNEAIKKHNTISFWEYYFKLIQLKQPILNLFSPIKCLKLEESYIPTLVKLMRIIFIFTINMFFNIFHLTQKYFSKKFNHFNDKYGIIYDENEKDISSSEIFSYAMGHSILSGFISFIICFIIQSLINFFVFNIKQKLNELAYNNKDTKERTNKIKSILNKARKKFIIFFSISFAVMIIVFYLMINYNEVYHGGILDLVGGAIWTVIFLQIFPFIYCLIFAFIRYRGIKLKNEKMYKFSQIIYF